MQFLDRVHAGQLLAERLKSVPLKDPMIITLPRGGVPLGYEIAKELNAPLEVLIVRKLGAPQNPEFGIGAITEGGYYWIDQDSAIATGISEDQLEEILNAEIKEVARRVSRYRKNRPLPSMKGRTVIVVDDGLATGVTARVAAHYLKEQGAERVLLAIPVCSPRTAQSLRLEVDDVICLEEPDVFFSVGQFYQNFNQTSDEEVISLISKSGPNAESQIKNPEKLEESLPICEEITIRGGNIKLPGSLAIPENAEGVVIFAHGSGSSRLSPRNQQVAGTLNEAGMGTLLFDLLTEDESLDRRNVFDIPFLSSRLALATRWLRKQKRMSDLPIGYFGASTGAGAALWAASELGNQVSAVVSRGGRPDLAIPKLPSVTAPTLLIVGGHDKDVIEMNEEAMKYLALSSLIIIPGATHLFEEPGTMEAVADEAASWFTKYLKKETHREAA